jgi:aldose sugar dehydrogenase
VICFVIYDVKYNVLLYYFILLISIASCRKSEDNQNDPNTDPPVDSTGVPQLTQKTILTGYEIIWGMDFLPNGDLIFGEKQGKIYRKSNDTVTELTGFPEVFASGQGGLLDIRVHPDYSKNGWIYASFSVKNPSGGGLLRLIRFNISNNQVVNVENIFTTNGSNTWLGHFGSRIAFDKSNYVYLSIGEGGPGTYGGQNTINKNAQDITSSWGKIHRLKDDGTIPSDNPVIDNIGPSSVFSYGHRNPQGLAINPWTGDLWESEHGPMGGDEINIIKAGANYGWPYYSLGLNYDGTKISDGHTAPGITEPIYDWVPSIATCGIAFITSNKFKSWKGSLLVSGLVSKKLVRCIVKDNKITGEETILNDQGRVRNVIQAPDGSIYVSVEEPGRVIQLIPE